MKKLLSLTLCIVMILSVVTVSAVSSTAVENTDENTTEAPSVSETAADTSAATDPADDGEIEAPSDEKPALAETGVDVVPVNLGNSFYACVKMINNASYYLTAPNSKAKNAFTRKATGYNNQVWHFTRKDNYYKIRSVALNSYLEVKSAEAKDGDLMYFTAERNAAEQKWIISKDATGYRIHSYVDSAFILSAVNPTASNSSIQLSSSLTNKNAYFSFEKLPLKSDKLATPTLTLSSHYQGVLLSWNAVPAAKKFRSYRYNESTKAWDSLGDTTATQFIDKTAASGHTYKYAVRAISPVMSDFLAKSISFIAAPRVTITNNNNGPTVSWKKCNGAAKYRVFVRTAKKWSTLVTTTSTSFLHKGFKYNQRYYYTVRCVSANGKTYTSAYNTTGVENMIVHTPEPKVSVMPFSLDVSWSKITGAAKYRVFVKSKATQSKWAKVADVAATSYRYSAVGSGKDYAFCVRALNGKGVLISGFKATASTYFYDAPVVKSISTSSNYNKISWYPVAGAVKYRIFAWNGKGWTKKGVTAEGVTTFNAPITGTKAQNVCYAVRCLDKNGKLISSYLETVLESGLKYYYPGQYSSKHRF